MFGKFQALVGIQLGMPPLLLPTLNSVGAEIGKPIAPQTASVGVSTSRFVRDEGTVIRHNMGWTLILLVYLIVISVGFYWLRPLAVSLPVSIHWADTRSGARMPRLQPFGSSPRIGNRCAPRGFPADGFEAACANAGRDCLPG
jgi:hypothetical protein